MILMKTNKFIFAVLTSLFIALIAISCSGNQKFDSVEKTETERYSIVYKDGKCGVFDNNADSLVTDISYDVLQYSKRVMQDSIGITVWICQQEDSRGLLFITEETNEFMGFYQ